MRSDVGVILLALVIAGALLLFLRSSSRRESTYLATLRAEADAQFKHVAIEAPDSRYSLNGQTAVTVLEQESVERNDTAILSYTLTRYVRNERGEYFMFKSTSGSPFVKHVSHEAARVVLKTKYVPPQNDG